ncbi:MAG: hypothetical protein WCB05_19540 [Candidatus Sulfotelmatobacter sp.]
MTEEKHSRWHWLNFLRHRLVLPALTAFAAHHLLYGELKPLVEGFPEPWPEVIAHPIVEFILDLLLSAAFFLGTLFVTKLAKFALTWLVFTGIAHYFLVRYAHAGKFSLYLLWCGVVWGAAALMLVRLFRASRDYYASMDEVGSGNLVTFVYRTDENGVPISSGEDEGSLGFDELYQFLWLRLLSGVTSIIATILLGVALWDGFGISERKSIFVASVAGTILAATQWWISRNPNPDEDL